MARKMKDSGIEWIGEIPEGWEVHRMKSCISQRDGGAWGDEATGETGDCICLRIADFDYGHFRFTDSNNLTIRHYASPIIKKLLLQKNDILIEKSGGGEKTPVGRTVLFDKEYPALFANFMDRLRCSDFILPQYLQYVFVTFYKNRYTQNYIKQTTGIQNLDLSSMLADEFVPVPNLNEQKLIVCYLESKCSKIDNLLSKTRSSIEEYKKLKQAVITQSVTKGVRGEREMKDSGVEWAGLVPHHWGVAKIGSIGQTSSGATPPRSKEASFFDDATIRWVRTLDLNDGLVYDSSEKITELALASSACSIMPKGTVCVAMYGGAGTIGKCGLLMSDCATNQAVCSIVCNREIVSPIFLLMQLLALKSYWMKYAVGTRKDPNISQDIVARMKILIPPLDEQKEITDHLDAKCAEIDGLIAKKEQLVKELESYKKSLIYEVVTGKREV